MAWLNNGYVYDGSSGANHKGDDGVQGHERKPAMDDWSLRVCRQRILVIAQHLTSDNVTRFSCLFGLERRRRMPMNKTKEQGTSRFGQLVLANIYGNLANTWLKETVEAHRTTMQLLDT